MNDATILDAQGQPMKRAASRAAMLAGAFDRTPYDAASMTNEHTASWQPMLLSPDAELNQYRDRMVSRARDLVRNDGWAAGTVTRHLDHTIGASFRPISKPDHRALAHYSGLAAFDDVWATEFAHAVDAHYRSWANDPARYCDAQRGMTLPQIFGVAFRHLLIDGDALAVLPWLKTRLGVGRARYATAVQLVDPDRLSNPQNTFDQSHMRGGVEVDDYGVAIAYHIRKAHQGDWWSAAQSVTWERIERETPWGRPKVVHYFEVDRAGQHRGGAGIFTPVLQRAKMLAKYDTAELDGAILNAIFAAIAESPMDHELIGEALGEGDLGRVLAYQGGRADFHDERRLAIGGSKVVSLYPGEKLSIVKSERPNANFPYFEKAVLRNIGAAAGGAPVWTSADYSDVNYTSLRGSLLDAWKTVNRRGTNFGTGFADPIRSAWLEECMEVEDLPMPAGAPEYSECRAAYSRCTWMRPGRGYLDEVGEKKGAVLGMDAGLGTLQSAAADNSGEDWEEILDQRKREIDGFKKRGLTPPTWSGMNPMGEPAQRTVSDPEAV